jgi:hypothetical protein
MRARVDFIRGSRYHKKIGLMNKCVKAHESDALIPVLCGADGTE